jgi:putative copper resistance protein D
MTLIDPLAVVRAIHFTATILAAGAAAFSVFVEEPLWQRSTTATQSVLAYRSSVAHLIWIGLAGALASAIAWLVLVAAEITGGPWTDAIRDGTAYAVLTDTQFGSVLLLRLLLATAMAVLLVVFARQGTAALKFLRMAAAATGAVLLGSLAWTGHAGGATGSDANVHLLADILHVLAAGAWIGGLFPLALLLARLGRMGDRQSLATCAEILGRFSNLGIVAVALLLASGVVNTWFLTTHMRGLVGTPYGQLLLIKFALFLAMLCLAADNRLRLLPRIANAENPGGAPALGRLRRNTTLEIVLGLVVIYVVGVLGLTPPAEHVHGADVNGRDALGGSRCIASGSKHASGFVRSALELPLASSQLAEQRPSRGRST